MIKRFSYKIATFMLLVAISFIPIVQIYAANEIFSGALAISSLVPIISEERRKLTLRTNEFVGFLLHRPLRT